MKNIIVFFLFTASLCAQTFRIDRPVKDYHQANGSYLYGEPNIRNNGQAHQGLDFSVDGDTVFSASEGDVYFIGYDPNNPDGYEPNGAGNYIIIRTNWNGANYYLLYMHLEKPLVSYGDTISALTPLAISGNTGYSTGPHLHFEIRKGTSYSGTRNTRNPELWTAIKGMGAIYGKVPGAGNSTRVDISPDPKPRPPYTTYGWTLTYNFADAAIGSDDVYQENYAIGDVKPGTYTITSINGYSRVVTVGAGEVVNADAPTSIKANNSFPDNFIVHQNYPNPFNPTTRIRVEIPSGEALNAISLKIYNQLGEEIIDLSDQIKNRGINEIIFNGSGLASGVYFFRVNSEKFSETKSMILLK